MLLSLRVAAAMTVASLSVATAASAAVITLNAPSTATITLECPLGCEGLVGDPGTWSATNADAYEIGDASEANIALAFSDLTGIDVDAGDVNKTDGGSENFSFAVTPTYFFAKYGPWTSFFRTDFAQSVTFTKSGPGPAGLSNYGTIDTPDTAPIPLPASALLLLGAIGGLGAMRSRRKA